MVGPVRIQVYPSPLCKIKNTTKKKLKNIQNHEKKLKNKDNNNNNDHTNDCDIDNNPDIDIDHK